mmetsp:Transcript_9311/g.14248  ORF Transcript_9311/g.14248 Transcript_9311/m.14248 type:complete len:216 (-) Transcript_9311:677-1324(-)
MAASRFTAAMNFALFFFTHDHLTLVLIRTRTSLPFGSMEHGAAVIPHVWVMLSISASMDLMPDAWSMIFALPTQHPAACHAVQLVWLPMSSTSPSASKKIHAILAIGILHTHVLENTINQSFLFDTLFAWYQGHDGIHDTEYHFLHARLLAKCGDIDHAVKACKVCHGEHSTRLKCTPLVADLCTHCIIHACDHGPHCCSIHTCSKPSKRGHIHG